MNPADWDHESYCVRDGCRNPACHSLIVGMVDDVPLFELVCCVHAAQP